MKISYEMSGELITIEIINLEDLLRLCKKVKKVNGDFWPPLSEQLTLRSGFDETQVLQYNDFCKKLRDRIGFYGKNPGPET